MTDPSETSPARAADVLAGLEDVRAQTRRRRGVPWFPLVCFGLLTAASAPVVAITSPSALGLFWLVAGPLGMVLVSRHYQARAQVSGVSGRLRPMSALTVAGAALPMVAGIGGGLALGEHAGVLAPVLVVFAAYLALGWLLQDGRPALALAPATGIAIALAVGDRPTWLVELVFGLGMSAGGAVLWLVARRP